MNPHAPSFSVVLLAGFVFGLVSKPALQADFAAAHAEVVATLAQPRENRTPAIRPGTKPGWRKSSRRSWTRRDPLGNDRPRAQSRQPDRAPQGQRQRKPVMLMAHTDVVGVDRSAWTVDPFAAVMKDGYMYGRGATDDKCSVAVYLEVSVLLPAPADHVPLDRDVIFSGRAERGRLGLRGHPLPGGQALGQDRLRIRAQRGRRHHRGGREDQITSGSAPRKSFAQDPAPPPRA